MKRTILIAEDYDDSRTSLKIILEIYGYQVVEAVDGLQAVEAIKKELPDLILMDISMPVMDGITATSTIRKITPNADIPIIAVTAFGNEFQKKAIEAGCNAIIEKPLNFDLLEATLKKYLH